MDFLRNSKHKKEIIFLDVFKNDNPDIKDRIGFVFQPFNNTAENKFSTKYKYVEQNEEGIFYLTKENLLGKPTLKIGFHGGLFY